MPDRFESRPGEKFFEEKDYAKAAGLRMGGKLGQAENLLMKAVPVPAVLDELRKVASAKAKLAKKEGDWAAVYMHLQGYLDYANKVRSRTIAMANQGPPELTATDKKLLDQAKAQLGKT